MTVESKHGYINVTVHGGEGETTDDIEDIAADRFERALDGHELLRHRDADPDSRSGFQ
jgi:riboflavin synthase